MARWKANLTLAMIALIWGATFTVVKDALDAVGPLTFVAFRFVAASVALAAIFHRRLRRITRAEALAGATIGVWLMLGYSLQTIGLQYTMPGKAGFITGLAVVLVPIFATVLLREPPGLGAVAGVGIATVGLALLSLNANLTIEPGDLWLMGCAVAFAMHLVTVERYASSFDTVRLSVAQMATVAVLAMGAAFTFETPSLNLPAETWAAIVGMGLIATALVFTLQIYVQRFTTSTATALIFSLEPVFAGFFGWWWAGEVLGPKELLGCALILAGMVLAELPIGQSSRAEVV
jgi:drug/metabolite transporter (DMT)-like permease